jgi:hypothetical protein
VPFKTNADRRHHIPKQRHQVTNWREYDEALRQRGSLTVWFTPAAIAAWRAEPRTTRGGQPHYSALAITTALTLRAVYRLALRQTEGLLGSIIRLLGLDLAVPDHSRLSRRAETLQLLRPQSSIEPMHLIVDSTGLKLCGSGEWLVEKHGTRTRRAWRKLHIGVDADTGEIVAVELTDPDVDDGAQVGPLLDQIRRPVVSFTGDGAFDRDDVYGEVAERHPDAAVIVPPRSSAVPSETAETAPTKRDRHLQLIAERGRMGWQKASGYNLRALLEADIGRYKRVIGDALRSRTNGSGRQPILRTQGFPVRVRCRGPFRPSPQHRRHGSRDRRRSGRCRHARQSGRPCRHRRGRRGSDYHHLTRASRHGCPRMRARRCCVPSHSKPAARRPLPA